MTGDARICSRGPTPLPPTIAARAAIGFPGHRRAWRAASAIFEAERLIILGHVVMERWETQYMRELARIVCSRGGHILEVGFGMGISAGFIQEYDIESHVVIEANRDVARRLRTFAKQARHPVVPILNFWELVVASLESERFTGILFDTYPLRIDEVHRNHFPFFREAYRLLRPGGVLTYYSDEREDYSPEHRAVLAAAGFTSVEKTICTVGPPADSPYWRHPTIVAPIVTKTR
jgi:guanidinoacetate N-methyltransferase